MKRLYHGIYLAALCATMASGLESQTLPSSFPATGSTVMTVLSTANLTGASCGTYNVQYYNALTNQHWACYNPNPGQNAMGTWVLVNSSSTPGGAANAIQFNNAGALGGVLNSSSTKGYLYQTGGAAPEFQLTPIPLSDIAAPSLTAGTNVTITGVWPNLTFSASGGGSQTGTLANIPATCTVGQGYFATDQPAGQQLYECSAANAWTQALMLGSSGGLQVADGALDINPAVVPELGTPNEWTGLNTFDTGYVMKEQSSGTTPSSGSDMLYVNSADHLLHTVDSSGTDTAIRPGFTGTAGSIPFVGSDRLPTEDNNHLFWDATDHRLGIGTKTPDSLLTAEDDDGNAAVDVIGSGNGKIYYELRNKQDNMAWMLGMELTPANDNFGISHDDGATFPFVIGQTKNVYLGGGAALSGDGAVVSIAASEGGHVYLHGPAPTVSGTNCYAGTNAAQAIGSVTSGSASLTVTSATGIAAGQLVVDAAHYIPSGSTVTAVDGTTVTISNAATNSLSTDYLYFIVPAADNDMTGTLAITGLSNDCTITFHTPWSAGPPVPLITNWGSAWASVVSASPTAVVIRQSYNGAVNVSYRMVGTK